MLLICRDLAYGCGIFSCFDSLFLKDVEHVVLLFAFVPDDDGIVRIDGEVVQL